MKPEGLRWENLISATVMVVVGLVLLIAYDSTVLVFMGTVSVLGACVCFTAFGFELADAAHEGRL